MALSATKSFVQNCVVEDLNSFPDQICHLIWTHTHPGRPDLTTVTPGVPIWAPKWPKTPPIYTHFLTHLLQWFKSCRCGPKFLPRPNLPLQLISTTSREATPQICDQRGPHPSPQMTQNTLKIDAFSPSFVWVVQILLLQLWIYSQAQCAASSNLIHIQGGSTAYLWPQAPPSEPPKHPKNKDISTCIF